MSVLRLRFRAWLFMQRVCDVIGPAIDAIVLRVPYLNARTGACVILHGVLFRGPVPEEWWDA